MPLAYRPIRRNARRPRSIRAITALLIACAGLALVPSCALTPEQKAKFALAAETGDKLVALGLKYHVLTPQQAEAAHDVGAIAVSTVEQFPAKSGKSPVTVTP